MSLKDLPSELITHICEVADKNALMVLRLTDKRISTSATKSLSGRFMSSFSVIMTRPCLERLINICEHSSFGPSVRKIFITSCIISKPHIERLANRLIEEDGDQSENIASTDLMIKRCMDQHHDEEALKKEGGPTILLTQAFTALKTWRYDVELSILPNPHVYDGVTFLYRDCFDFRRTNSRLGSTLQPCLDAVRISKMEFCKFYNLRRRDFLGIFAHDDFNLDSFNKEDMECFSMLKSITSELPRQTSDKTVRAMATIISQARELEVLHLSGRDCFADSGPETTIRCELGDNALRSVKSHRIKALSLTEMMFSKQCLLESLVRYRNTLESLRFAHCALRDGSWYEVLSYMKDSLPLLTTLNIEFLYKLNWWRNSEAIVGSKETLIKGKVEVQAALQAIIERPLDDPLARHPDVQDDEAPNESDG
jgi:hypothetical protein